MFARKQKQTGDGFPGFRLKRAGEFRWPLSALFLLCCLMTALGQDAGTNTGTTNALETNMVNPDTILTNALPSATNEAAGATNLFGVAPIPPLLLGPRTLGGNQLNAPILGTGVLAPPPGAAVARGPGIPVGGPIVFHPSLNYSFLYGTGIEAQPGQQKATAVNTFSVGLLFDLGTHWMLDYTPSYTMYSDNSFQNTLSHSLALTGVTTYEDWAFSFSQTYVTSDQPLVETGTQTAEENYGTVIGAAYQMGSKLSLHLSASQELSYADPFDDVSTWTGSAGLNYQFVPEFGVGLVFSGGYNDVTQGSSSPYEDIQGSLNFRPGKKLTFVASAGVEDMQFIDPSAPPLISPIFSGALSYMPFTGTALSISASRSVTPALYANQVEQSTSVSVGLSQQLSRRFTMAVNAGYSTEPLTQIVPAPLPPFFLGRPPQSTLSQVENNDTRSVTISLSYRPINNGAISIFYSASQNTTGQANYSYSSSQFGLNASYSY